MFATLCVRAANLVWYKIRKDGGPDGRGVGFYFRNVTEILLFGVRGSMRTLHPGRTQVNVIEERKREHSRKPEQSYDVIESCSPGPYLELFARHPRTREVMQPTPLGGEPVDTTKIRDPRLALAKWLTAPENPYFARNIANRTWAYFMGTGLVEAIDDMRASNPPSNAELLDALAADFVRNGFNLRKLMRVIMTSRVY